MTGLTSNDIWACCGAPPAFHGSLGGLSLKQEADDAWSRWRFCSQTERSRLVVISVMQWCLLFFEEFKACFQLVMGSPLAILNNSNANPGVSLTTSSTSFLSESPGFARKV